MAQVVWAAASAIEALGATAIAGTGLTVGGVASSVATLAAISAIGRALQPSFDASSLSQASPLQLSRDPNPARRGIYGRVRVSGNLRFAQATSSNDVLHLVVVFCSHEIDGFDPVIYVDDKVFETDGPEVLGAYHEYITFVDHLGTDDQTYDTILSSEVGSGVWGTNHRLRGNAYNYFRLVYDPDLFPGGPPNLSRVIRGKKIHDLRDGGQDPDTPGDWTFSENTALQLLDFLRNDIGSVYPDEFDVDSFTAAANACDETVTRAGGFSLNGDTTDTSPQVDMASTAGVAEGMTVSGTNIPAGARVVYVQEDTHIILNTVATGTGSTISLTFDGDEPRYRSAFMYERVGDYKRAVIQQLLAAMAGELYHVDGKWILHAGVARTPEGDALTETDLIGPWRTHPRDDLRDAINRVRGTFAFPADGYVRRDFPPVVNGTYLSEDGGRELWGSLDLPAVQSGGQAQRIAKIELEKNRQDITLEVDCKLTVLRYRPGDVIPVTVGLWEDKPFLVVKMSDAARQADGGAPLRIIQMVLREYSSASFDWNSGEETTVDPSPNTQLPPGYAGEST